MAKTNKELIKECYDSGGSPIVTLGGTFISCASSRMKKAAPVYMGADGFYNCGGSTDGFHNAAGLGCAVQFPFNKTKRDQCEQRQAAMTMAKVEGENSDAQLNAALANALNAQANAQSQTGPSAGKVVLVIGASAAVILGAIWVIRKFRKSKAAA